MKNNLLIYTLVSTLIVLNLNADKKVSSGVNSMLQKAQESVKVISTKKFYEMVEEDEDFIQLDVRENNENGHGEIFSLEKVKLTRGYIEYKVERSLEDKDSKIIVVCCSGKRAVLAAKTLQEMGYTDVSYLKGGVRGWLQDGYPLDTVYGELFLAK